MGFSARKLILNPSMNLIWNQNSLPQGGNHPTAIWTKPSYGKGIFVSSIARVYSSTSIIYSYDGFNWTALSSPPGSPVAPIPPSLYGWSCTPVLFDGEKFSFKFGPQLVYSYDGIIWKYGYGYPKSEVFFGNYKFRWFGVRNNSNLLEYSNDGITYYSNISPLPQNLTPSITWAYGNNRIVVLSPGSSYCFDKINSRVSISNPIISSKYPITYGKGIFVALGYDTNECMRSTDGINWTKSTMPKSKDWFDIHFDYNKFIAVTQYDPAYAESYDGVNWIIYEEGNNNNNKRSPNNIQSGNNRFIGFLSRPFISTVSYT